MKYFALFFLVIAMSSSCRKKQPEIGVAQNACDCISEVSADFIIEEAGGYGTPFEKRTETDTIFKGRNVVFTAREQAAEYKWYIGSEVLNDKSFGRYFDWSQAGQNIPVTLVVKKKPNSICFPHDDGYDSIVKVFNVSYAHDDIDSIFQNPSWMFEGVFRMKDKNGADSVDITIDLHYDGLQGGTLRIYNYDGQGGNSPLDYYGGFNGINYRQLWYEHNQRRNSLFHKINGEIELNMVSYNTIPPVKSYYYKGRKL
jgi:hypothetical protein